MRSAARIRNSRFVESETVKRTLKTLERNIVLNHFLNTFGSTWMSFRVNFGTYRHGRTRSRVANTLFLKCVSPRGRNFLKQRTLPCRERYALKWRLRDMKQGSHLPVANCVTAYLGISCTEQLAESSHKLQSISDHVAKHKPPTSRRWAEKNGCAKRSTAFSLRKETMWLSCYLLVELAWRVRWEIAVLHPSKSHQMLGVTGNNLTSHACGAATVLSLVSRTRASFSESYVFRGIEIDPPHRVGRCAGEPWSTRDNRSYSITLTTYLKIILEAKLLSGNTTEERGYIPFNIPLQIRQTSDPIVNPPCGKHPGANSTENWHKKGYAGPFYTVFKIIVEDLGEKKIQHVFVNKK
ncbi:unnamed protein product [Nesidiocoris tenuis]|uniref:Uncharacterized protein n=1 Tax=Nesidiocoris tenuis TaxID=355587 RepID=A0A6H5GCR6_9HEMI|nr:unnamed protein product [Nesidiocoris tenuis]